MNEQKKMVQDIQHTVIYNAPIQRVWKAVSSAEGIASWFMPNDFQPVVGHEFHIQSPFGSSPCQVLVLDPPNHLSFAWDEFGWIVTFKLKELDGKTEFTLTHSGWGDNDRVIPKANQKASIIRGTMNNGWGGIVLKLKKVVENE